MSDDLVQPLLVKVKAARRESLKARKHFLDAIQKARKNGHSLAAIGEAAGVSRQAIAKLLVNDREQTEAEPKEKLVSNDAQVRKSHESASDVAATKHDCPCLDALLDILDIEVGFVHKSIVDASAEEKLAIVFKRAKEALDATP